METERISVSELASRMNKTKQTAYNHVKAGIYKTQEFSRGNMRGLLVEVVKGTDIPTKID